MSCQVRCVVQMCRRCMRVPLCDGRHHHLLVHTTRTVQSEARRLQSNTVLLRLGVQFQQGVDSKGSSGGTGKHEGSWDLREHVVVVVGYLCVCVCWLCLRVKQQMKRGNSPPFISFTFLPPPLLRHVYLLIFFGSC